MSKLQLQRYEVITAEGQTVQLEYDPASDMLEIFFATGAASMLPVFAPSTGPRVLSFKNVH
jgi:YD repeat-containing protein